MQQELLTDPEASKTGHQQTQARLAASRRRASGALVFPRVPETSPAASGYEPVELSASATLYSFTTIHPNPKTGEPPFTVVYADFAEGARVFGRLRLSGEVPRIGMRLNVIVEPNTDGQICYFFVPASEVSP
jgi:uncharacterized protein